ncbi:hypothetical protein [Streptomyces pinistramenti]|uniref:hypothetical protein n=1 Tax=Streptomyces pinistramenti TaxID=2884812 RepID=UPI001D080759|nr:hypothetical protein [Streptomyces pinistramenti]MCB5906524.1 hypothetical protein [Streptomyces pinistramenti]
MSDGASFRADAHDNGRIQQAGRDLNITYGYGTDEPGDEAPPAPEDLLAAFAAAPLPVHVLSPQALAAVPVPGIPAERLESAVRALPAAAAGPVADGGRDAGEAAPPVLCIRPDAAVAAQRARGLSEAARARLDACAAALLDRALLRVAEGPVPDLLAPHVRALLWRSGGDRTAALAAGRRIRDAYERCGRYEEALPFAARIAECAPGDERDPGLRIADGLALGELHSRCGDFAEADAVLRPVLAQAEQEVSDRGLTLAGRTGPSLAELFRENVAGPFTGKLSTVDCEVLARAADVLYAVADARYGLRRYAESERLLHSAAGLRWRVLGGAHPARMLAQLRRARALGRQRLWHEAMSLVHDALAFRDADALDRDHPRDAALVRLAHAEVTAAAVRSLREEGDARTRGVGIFPAPVVRFLDSTMGNGKPEKLTSDDAGRLAREAARACERAFGPGHPQTRAARELLARETGGGAAAP